MTLILRLIDEDSPAGVFDDHATKVMGEAFEAACKDLDGAGQHTYEVIAKRIIEAAKSGERDPEKLRDWALTAFGRKQGGLAGSLGEWGFPRTVFAVWMRETASAR